MSMRHHSEHTAPVQSQRPDLEIVRALHSSKVTHGRPGQLDNQVGIQQQLSQHHEAVLGNGRALAGAL